MVCSQQAVAAVENIVIRESVEKLKMFFVLMETPSFHLLAVVEVSFIALTFLIAIINSQHEPVDHTPNKYSTLIEEVTFVFYRHDKWHNDMTCEDG